MNKTTKDKLDKIPILNWIVKLLKRIQLPGSQGFSVYDLLEMYVIGIFKGALTTRASAIAFSFFTAIFPFLLFIIILIPYIPFDNFKVDFLDFLDSILPPQTTDFFNQNIFENINDRSTGGLLSTVFLVSMFLMANGVNAVFSGFENSNHQQLNRNLGRLGQHSNAVIGNIRPINISDHALPGRKGRGAIAFEVGESNPLLIVVAHLALGRRNQDAQLKYIGGLIGRYRNVVLMGDMNTDSLRILNDSPLRNAGLKSAHARATYPSWRPTKCYDQILVSAHIKIIRMAVLDFVLSDHLPVAIEIELPK
jgi:hypothetical protein